MTPLFLEIEYRTPNFPEDEYGFTQEDRLRFAPLALEYLLNNEGISFLGDQTFDDGSPLYNERELGHMIDVKNLIQLGLKVWYGLLVLFAALGIWAWKAEWIFDYRMMLVAGAKLTISLIILLILFVLINFNNLFVGFHRIFFEGNTWVFLFSDSLIRLFPIRFWRDAFIGLGGFTLIWGGLLWYFLRIKLKG